VARSQAPGEREVRRGWVRAPAGLITECPYAFPLLPTGRGCGAQRHVRHGPERAVPLDGLEDALDRDPPQRPS